jgi:hypothetical protein
LGISTTSKTSSIKSGGGLQETSGNNATFVETKIESGGDASIAAAGDVKNVVLKVPQPDGSVKDGQSNWGASSARFTTLRF